MIGFTVPFVKGKQRHRLDRRHARMYTPDDTLRAERTIREAVCAALAESRPGAPLPPFGKGVPVVVRVDAYLPLQKSQPKRVAWVPFTVKPDADNIAKLVLDGMNGVVYEDDSQVVDLHVAKWPRVRGTEPHMYVQVSRGWEPGHRNETEE